MALCWFTLISDWLSCCIRSSARSNCDLTRLKFEPKIGSGKGGRLSKCFFWSTVNGFEYTLVGTFSFWIFGWTDNRVRSLDRARALSWRHIDRPAPGWYEIAANAWYDGWKLMSRHGAVNPRSLFSRTPIFSFLTFIGSLSKVVIGQRTSYCWMKMQKNILNQYQ